MSKNQHSGELVHVSSFTTQSAARRFAHMIAANVRRFEAVDVRPHCDFWLVTWRSRGRCRQTQGVRS